MYLRFLVSADENSGNDHETADMALCEAVAIFMKALFKADDMDQDLESVPATTRTAALVRKLTIYWKIF